MKIEYYKIEFDMNEFAPLLLQDKQEGFIWTGEAVLEKKLSEFIGVDKSQRSKHRN